ncbi:hypothetical protein RJ639_025810 [Escallonia herrerae]|uniref:Serine-threonine/tyrosine-protein kinase catalytic domain-containing protein n=1 Tax=Escallonia herrerae TaxID=1293975 RepID=A0AA89ABP2_9ASTE|nr:hypothetical protein RJ639_025810 [Escallonia herrerae]
MKLWLLSSWDEVSWLFLYDSGYIAPEYARREILSQKADVYSFGVLLLEIVSGKSNAVSRPNRKTVYLLDMAYDFNKQGCSLTWSTKICPTAMFSRKP